jgi:hypothetical protein
MATSGDPDTITTTLYSDTNCTTLVATLTAKNNKELCQPVRFGLVRLGYIRVG